jgi:hypothetical protein
MPSKKQRRRRAKQKRHEWEEVYVDEEGRELDPDEAEALVGPKDDRREARAGKERAPERGRRAVEPPSWRKTLRRGALFFPLMLVTVFLLAGDEITTAQKILQTLVLMAFFLPFSYFMDSMVWRSYQRRLARGTDAKKR